MKVVAVAIVAGLAIMMMCMIEPMQATIDECLKLKFAFYPCLQYLEGFTKKPCHACCKGMKTIKSLTPTREDRRDACRCLKEGIAHIPIIIDYRVIALPQNCRVDMGVPISKDTICSE
ncbi:Non-specific lipid-transfer protein A [Senna tora]|uniref:Non-specific lipid-transfer protein A n=1 Tax=Senna tora TaxID=362788 RepID=A0A835CAJ5_9FABA|nr:Non-specific lipid-transfer protein A [Senna tora]